LPKNPRTSELNAIHAFREGNGRTQLSFFLFLADQAGHPVDLEKLDPNAFLEAMIASFKGNEVPLAAAIENMAPGSTRHGDADEDT
jgi:cell filamentation protein